MGVGGPERGKEAALGGEEIKYFMMTCCLRGKKQEMDGGSGGVEGVFNGEERRSDGSDTLICPV